MGVVERTQLSTEENASHVELVTFKDSSRAVYKREKYGLPGKAKDENDAEELALPVARILGLDPPEVYRASPSEIYTTYVDDGEIGADYLQADLKSRAQITSTLDARRMGLLDVLISNEDRNTGNWFVRGDTIIPIDHGAAFTHAHDFDMDAMPGYPGDFTMPYVDAWDWKDNDLSRTWLESLRPKLKALAPEFNRLGREEWLKGVLTRLDVLIDHARGRLTL